MATGETAFELDGHAGVCRARARPSETQQVSQRRSWFGIANYQLLHFGLLEHDCGPCD